MKIVFEQGEFRNYKKENINEAMQPITESYYYSKKKITIFISHKHSDLDELKDIIGFLEKNYDVNCYIDSDDPSMPEKTSGETATRIKDRIKKCDKFILLATNDAIMSKWCNWELGYGDAQKYKKNIALFPIKPSNSFYKGNEYMEIYPYIIRCDSGEKYSNGSPVISGYYIRTENAIEPLKDWLKN